MELNKPAFLFMLLLSIVLIGCNGVEGSCTVKNNSGKKVIITPVEVGVSIEVDVGATVTVPTDQEYCTFTNGDSGHELGPVTLPDGGLVVCVDGAVSGTVDVCVASIVLGIIQLGLKLLVSL